GTKDDPHYFAQRGCLTVPGPHKARKEGHDERSDDAESLTIAHCAGRRNEATCDRCPWADCPQQNPTHSQRSTELYIRSDSSVLGSQPLLTTVQRPSWWDEFVTIIDAALDANLTARQREALPQGVQGDGFQTLSYLLFEGNSPLTPK